MKKENKVLIGGSVAIISLLVVLGVLSSAWINTLGQRIDQLQTRMSVTESKLEIQQQELLSLKQPSVNSDAARPNQRNSEIIGRSELYSYMPEYCPPSDEYAKTRVEGGYSVIELDCADSNWAYRATLVRDKVTGKDIVAFRMSTEALIWKTLDGAEHAVSAIGDKPWDSFTEFGGSNPITIEDLTLDGKPLHILDKTFVYADGGLGAFQDAKFVPDKDFTGGQLTVNGKKYLVDFSRVTIEVAK